MKRSSTAALPLPKMRKQAPVDDHKSATSKPKATTTATSSEPKSILKKPLRPEPATSDAKSPSKPKGSISGAAILKANTKANKASSESSKKETAGSGSRAGGKPKAVLRQPVMASRGDVTGGMGRKRKARVEETDEVNSGDDSDSENDGEDERESDEGDDDDEDDLEGLPGATKGKKTSKKRTEENMAEAMSKILGSTLRKADASQPILARSRGVERKLEEEKMEAKARKAITNEKRRLANKDRVKPEYTGMEYEKKLRKVATRGVVQLFNAIKTQQKATDDLTQKARPITTNAKDKAAASALEHISKYNKYLNAFIDIADPETIRNQAKEATQRWENGKFHDLAMVDFQAPYTATAVELLQQAGVIMGGKANMDEFGMGSHNVFSHAGVTRNPYGVVGRAVETLDEAEGRSPGGSSGGSAAAVASNMCFAALGSDTGGSVRLPASYCGVVGFKPSYGRISRWGLVAYASSLDTVGLLAKTVENAKTIYDIISKEDPKDSSCLTQQQRDLMAKGIKPINLAGMEDSKKPLSGVRVGVPQEFNIAELSPATKTLWKRGIQAMKDAGAIVIPVSLPNTKLAVGAYLTLATAEASSNLQRYDGIRYGHQSEKMDEKDALYSHTRSEGFGKEVRRRILLGTYVLTSGSFDNFFLRAQKIRQIIRKDFDNIFARPNMITGSLPGDDDAQKVHALLTPVAVTTAPKLEDVVGDHINPVNAYLDDIFTIPASLAGLPAMSVPFGNCTSDGFPMGLQIVSQYGDEDMLFKVGQALEERGQAHMQC
ncbi:Trimeric GatFAB AmidoTransferase(AdT) complex subunit [Dissophora ornata]|nr:Trimeric GatFAB AmidoTransferase(AdT) complex subunit [Dissophora ornata]